MNLIGHIPGVGPTAPFSPGPTTPAPWNMAHTGATDGTGPATATKNMAEIYNRLLLQDAALIQASGLAIDNDNWAQKAQAVVAIAQTAAAASAAKGFKDGSRFTTTGNIVLSGLGTQAGGDWAVALTVTDRIFVKNQALGYENGWYAAAAGVWARTADADTSAKMVPGSVGVVQEGATLGDTLWMLTTDGPIVLGTTPLVFTKQGGSTAATGFRNKIINGAMMVDQRNLGVAQTFTAAAALAYCVDRWYGYCTGANITGQQVAGPIANTYRYQFVGAVSNTGFGFGTRLEAVDTARMAGSTANLSAKIKSSALASITWSVYYASTKDTFGTLASPTRTLIATGTFAISAAEATYNAQIAIPGGATTGIEVVFTGGALVSGQTASIGDIQLEQATAATEFEVMPYSLVLATCQRYFQKLKSTIGGSYPDGGTTGYVVWLFKADMRVAPTINLVGSTGTLAAPGIDSVSLYVSAANAIIGAGSTASAEL